MRGGKVMIESERSSDQEEADDWRSTRGLLVDGDGIMGRLLMDEDVSRVAGVIGVVDDGWDMMTRDYNGRKGRTESCASLV